MILDIIVNGLRVDILDRSSVNLRLNNVLYNPTEINNKLAEYSFSFNLPTTPHNNKIFNYVNVLSKTNKFQDVYRCEVYSDEILIFEGSLRVQSIKKGFYNVNLVNIKINTVDEIFGEMRLNDLDWKIPFTGARSINVHNASEQYKVAFPLVSYGVFLKEPSSVEYDYNNYTSKFKIDKYNKWYYESFNPSPNLLEMVKRLFKLKGFKVVGDIFQDPIINKIYTSINIANDLIPTYNIGYPTLGKATIRTLFSNKVNKNTGNTNEAYPLVNDLSYPYLKLRDNFNFGKVNVFDLWSNENSKITKPDELYLFDDSSNCIVIPADGLYKVRIKAEVNVPTTADYQGMEWYQPADRYKDPEERVHTLEKNIKRDMPVEILIVKNEDACELIHGAYQWEYYGPDRSISEWKTAYPHELLYSASNPSVTNAQYSTPIRDSNGRTGGRVEHNRRPGSGTHIRPGSSSVMLGYMPNEGDFLAYDPWVNPNFIAGLSSMSSGTPSFIKNGYSWNKSDSSKTDSRYVCEGYYKHTRTGRRPNVEYKIEKTDYNKNQLIDSPANYCRTSTNTFDGEVSGIVYLKRNDVLMLKAVSRYWENDKGTAVNYEFNTDVTVELEAYSPNPIETIDSRNKTWNDISEFDLDLLIGNFLNKEVKVSDFINNFLKLFNLLYVNIGDTVILDTQNLDIDKPKYAINIDDRVNTGESKLIDYPNYMEVKYKIDTEEWGFETTVPKEHINDPNWKDYGDYGYDRIDINDRPDGKGEEIQVNTSYCWYDMFEVWGNDDALRGTLKIPVISKYSYMIDGYSYEESMKHDGKSLPMRYWFRGYNTQYVLNVNNKYPVYIYNTTNDYKGFDLSYKNTPNTLLSKYFNINPDLSGNYISVNCYLNAQEYEAIKNGANIIFDSDVYIVSEIQGYDAMGINETELLLIKKK